MTCVSFMHTACARLRPPSHLAMLELTPTDKCGRKKLPFAGYSVVKELTRLQALGSRLWAIHASDEIPLLARA